MIPILILLTLGVLFIAERQCAANVLVFHPILLGFLIFNFVVAIHFITCIGIVYKKWILIRFNSVVMIYFLNFDVDLLVQFEGKYIPYFINVSLS